MNPYLKDFKEMALVKAVLPYVQNTDPPLTSQFMFDVI